MRAGLGRSCSSPVRGSMCRRSRTSIPPSGPTLSRRRARCTISRRAAGDRRFESRLLQWGVRCEPAGHPLDQQPIRRSRSWLRCRAPFAGSAAEGLSQCSLQGRIECDEKWDLSLFVSGAGPCLWRSKRPNNKPPCCCTVAGRGCDDLVLITLTGLFFLRPLGARGSRSRGHRRVSI
jgi:hypothetical protein